MEIREDIKKFILNNANTVSYGGITFDYEYESGITYHEDSIKESHVRKAIKDLEIAKERTDNFNKIEGYRVGDYIKLPDGQYVVISHIWDDTVQTSGGGSLHLHSCGKLDFSGGMDSGVNKIDLVPTEEYKTLNVWIFHMGRSGANSAVRFDIETRVYETKDGADLSGVPQVEKLHRELLAQKAETVTRVNGNGKSYTLPLPRLRIVNRCNTYNKDGDVISGLNFEPTYWSCLETQPMKMEEIEKLLAENNFKATFYNNSEYKNTLMLEPLSDRDRNATKAFPM